MHLLIIMFELGLHGEIIVNSSRQRGLIKKIYIVINFRDCRISLNVFKLVYIFTLIKKK